MGRSTRGGEKGSKIEARGETLGLLSPKGPFARPGRALEDVGVTDTTEPGEQRVSLQAGARPGLSSERAPTPGTGTRRARPALRDTASPFLPPPSGSRGPSHRRSSLRGFGSAPPPPTCGHRTRGFAAEPLPGSRRRLASPPRSAARAPLRQAPLRRCYDNEKARIRNPHLSSREVTLVSSNQRPVSSCAGQ